MSRLKILFIVLVLFFVTGITSPQYLNGTGLKNNNSVFADSTKKKIKLTEKSPLFAGSLSLLLPGLALGQLYNEDFISYAIHFGISAAIFTFTVAAGNAKLYVLGLGDVGGGPGTEGKREWIFVVCVLSYIGNWLWSTIDAVHYATMNNRELERQRKAGYNNIRLQFAPGIGKNDKPNFNISAYF